MSLRTSGYYSSSAGSRDRGIAGSQDRGNGGGARWFVGTGLASLVRRDLPFNDLDVVDCRTCDLSPVPAVQKTRRYVEQWDFPRGIPYPTLKKSEPNPLLTNADLATDVNRHFATYAE
jgi:hypothetical protein